MRTRCLELVGLIFLLGCGCGTGLDETQPDDPYAGQSFGQQVFTLLCQRLTYSEALDQHQRGLSATVDVSGVAARQLCRTDAQNSPADEPAGFSKTKEFLRHQRDFVNVVDELLRADELNDVQRYLERSLPLTDDGSLPALVKGIGNAAYLAQQSPITQRALMRYAGRRDGYQPLPLQTSLVADVMTWADLRAIALSLFQLLRGQGKQDATDVVTALSGWLHARQHTDFFAKAGLQLPSTSAEHSMRLLVDLLLAEDPTFGSRSGPVWLARRDWRGVATVQRDANSQIPAPFVDKNADGQADVNEQGLFVSSGAKVPRPFTTPGESSGRIDALGRPVHASGGLYYAYVNLDATLLSAVLTDAANWFDGDRSLVVPLLLGLGPLLGDRPAISPPQTNARFDADKSILSDLVFAGLQLGQLAESEALMQIASRMFAQHESESARLFRAVMKAWDLWDQHPQAKLAPNHQFFEDAFVVLRQMAKKKGLFEDLLAAFSQPKVKALVPMFANYLEYRDVHVLDDKGEKVTKPELTQKVDRTKSDSGSNRSIQQRLWHVIHDTSRLKMCNKDGATVKLPLLGIQLAGPFKACELFEITDGAVFYAQTIAKTRDGNGKLTTTPKATFRLKLDNLPGWLKTAIQVAGEDRVIREIGGIPGFSTHPTSESIDRVLFMKKLPENLAAVMDRTVDTQGHRVDQAHTGSLLAWEIRHPQLSCNGDEPCRFADAFAPIVQAFADHDAEPLLVALINTVHRHWPSEKSQDHQFKDESGNDFAEGTAIVRYEPLAVQILRNTELVPALTELLHVLGATPLDSGKSPLVVLASAVRQLVDPDQTPTIARRDGSDRGKVAAGLLLLDALKAASAQWETQPAAKVALKRVLRLYLDASNNDTAHPRFKNRRIGRVVNRLAQFCQTRIAAHRTRRDLAAWLGTTLPSKVDALIESDATVPLLSFAQSLSDNPGAHQAFSTLARRLLDPVPPGQADYGAISALTALADLLQLLQDETTTVPLLRWLGASLDQTGGLGAALVHSAPSMIELDTTSILSRTTQRLFRYETDRDAPIDQLMTIFSRVQRKNTGTSTPLLSADFGELSYQIYDFLNEQQRGFINFFEVVKNRCAGPCR